MLQKGLVSVIIPTFNRADVIEETVRSVLAQTYSFFEIIIVDDGSNDNTSEVVKCLNDSRIRYYFFENSGLPAVSRNKGLRLANGEFVAFLDSDDLWLPEKLAKQVKILQEQKDVFLVYSQCIVKQNERIIKISPLHPKSGHIFCQLYLAYNMIPCMAVIMRNRGVDSPYFFDENPFLRAAEDYDLWLTISRTEKIVGIAEPLTVYCLHADNISQDFDKTIKQWKFIINKFRPFVPRHVLIRKLFSFYIKKIIIDAQSKLRSIILTLTKKNQ
jgi:glycosyltransferase involved in cell wall biosynthesis